MARYSILTFLTVLFCLPLSAQVRDSVRVAFDETLDGDLDHHVTATFKTTRIANGHTVEQCKPGVLDMRINHRFGRISDGVHNFFGLDNAVTRIGFDYGINDYLMVGIGRSTLNKEYDGSVKVRIWRQTKGGIPVTVSYLTGAAIVTEKNRVENLPFFNRVTYLHQVLVARKFSENLSLQLMPVFMHFNMTALASEKNSIGAAGIGGRYKISKRNALTFEYYYVPTGFRRAGNRNPLTIGWDIETGGHVFQLFFSNASGISERSLFTATHSQWAKGQLHFGFNLSRVFTVRSDFRAPTW